MKKIIAAVIALDMVLALGSCGHKHETHSGKCAKCGEYVLDELYVPTYEDYTACKNSSSIPSWLTVSDTNTETDRKILECTSSEKKFPDDSKNSVISVEYAEFDNEEIISDISVSYTLNDLSLTKETGDAIAAEMDRRYGNHSETPVYGGDFEWIHDNSGVESVSVLNIEDDCIRISERETAPEDVRGIQKKIDSLDEEFVPEKEEDFNKVLEEYNKLDNKEKAKLDVTKLNNLQLKREEYIKEVTFDINKKISALETINGFQVSKIEKFCTDIKTIRSDIESTPEFVDSKIDYATLDKRLTAFTDLALGIVLNANTDLTAVDKINSYINLLYATSSASSAYSYCVDIEEQFNSMTYKVNKGKIMGSLSELKDECFSCSIKHEDAPTFDIALFGIDFVEFMGNVTDYYSNVEAFDSVDIDYMSSYQIFIHQKAIEHKDDEPTPIVTETTTTTATTTTTTTATTNSNTTTATVSSTKTTAAVTTKK